MADHATIPGLKRHMKHSAPIPEHLQVGIAHIAESDCPVLIAGEHGVGKRTIARQIHAMSRRSRGTFTEMESAEVSEEALSALLQARGTLYLAEIGDLSLSLQEWLVNACQGLDWSQSCRLICGTGRELLDEVRDWHMREDFYYLVSSVTLRIAPLRYRKVEIQTIADDLLAHYAKQFDRPRVALGEEIAGFLLQHTWPDNLDELQTAMKTVAAIDDPSISLAALKAAAAATKLNVNRRTSPLKQAARVASTQIERRMISEVMAATGGNRKRAADELGISYKALLYKLKQAGIDSAPASSRNGVER
ncbi:MAG: sigma 54-interacting transcriptional regulator [Terracidiphilus sp.]